MKDFLSVLEKAGVSAWVWDLRTETFMVTPGVWEELGHSGRVPKTVGEWRKFIHRNDLKHHKRRIDDFLAGQSEQLHSNFRIKGADEEWRLLEARGRVVERGAGGEPLFIGGTICDITRTTPLTSPALFRTVVEAANEGIWMIDREARTWFANQSMADMLGTTPDAMSGRPPTEFCFPEDADTARNVILQNLAGIPVEFEFRFRRPDGTEIPVLGGSAPIRDDNDVITGSVGMFSDLTARKAAEKALFESERQARDDHARLAAAQEGAGAGTWEVDLGNDLVVLDDLSLTMHGLSKDASKSMTIKQWRKTIDGNDNILVALRDCAINDEEFRFEFSTLGGNNWILGLGRALRDDAGNHLKVVGLNLDITDSKHAEQQLLQVRSELIHLARQSGMGGMASTIAHELNQPLAATVNYLRVAELMMIRDDTSGAVSAVKSASRATLKAGQMIRRIRESAVKRGPVRRELDLRDIINSALQFALLDAPEKGVRVRRHLRRGIIVSVDSVQIEQVLINLVRNAIDAISEMENPKIAIAAGTTRGKAFVQVTDNGPGVSEHIQGNIFNAFASSKDSGMGLGLSICRTIIESHEGKIWLEKSSSEGTAFKFDLPLMNVQELNPR